MTDGLSFVPMRRSHFSRCMQIASGTGPWKRLNERLPIRELTGRNKNRAVVCLSGREIAGFVIFNPAPVFARGGYLRALVVAPRFRRQGIGRRLLGLAEQASSRQAHAFYLCVSSFNRSAQRFYRQCGYRKAGSLPGLIDPRHAEYLFWKKLRHSA